MAGAGVLVCNGVAAISRRLRHRTSWPATHRALGLHIGTILERRIVAHGKWPAGSHAPLRQGKLSGWLERGVAAAVRLPRCRLATPTPPMQVGPHAASMLACSRPDGAPDASRCDHGRGGSPAFRARMRPLRRLGYARGCGCGCFRLRERAPALGALAAAASHRCRRRARSLERHACTAVASTVVSRVPCSRLGAGFRAPAPINFFFSKGSLGFFLIHPPLSKSRGGHGTWNRAARRQRPASVANRPPSRQPPLSRQPEGGCCQRPTIGPRNGPMTQRPTANGQVGGVP